MHILLFLINPPPHGWEQSVMAFHLVRAEKQHLYLVELQLKSEDKILMNKSQSQHGCKSGTFHCPTCNTHRYIYVSCIPPKPRLLPLHSTEVPKQYCWCQFQHTLWFLRVVHRHMLESSYPKPMMSNLNAWVWSSFNKLDTVLYKSYIYFLYFTLTGCTTKSTIQVWTSSQGYFKHLPTCSFWPLINRYRICHNFHAAKM